MAAVGVPPLVGSMQPWPLAPTVQQSEVAAVRAFWLPIQQTCQHLLWQWLRLLLPLLQFLLPPPLQQLQLPLPLQSLLAPMLPCALQLRPRRALALLLLQWKQHAPLSVPLLTLRVQSQSLPPL